MPQYEYEPAVTLRDLHEDIKGLRTDVTTVLATLATSTATQNDHETRIRAMERKIWAVSGSLALAAAVVPNLGPLSALFGG